MERPWYTRFNWPLAIAPILITMLGIVFIRSATLHAPYAADEWRKQLIYGLVGIAMMLATAFVDYRVWRRWALPLYLVTLGLLIFITFKGHSVQGASRWIGVGPFQFQPSEPAKVVLAISIAGLLCRGTYRRVQELWLPLVAVALPVGVSLTTKTLDDVLSHSLRIGLHPQIVGRVVVADGKRVH